jgi:Fic family protein
MRWNWEQPEWPEFAYDAKALEALERRFLLQSGEFMGVFRHVGADDRNALRVELIGEEAVKTSAIEGEILNRDSVQSSLRHQFGLGPESASIAPAERGIAALMVDLYERFADPLTDATLFAWHRLLLGGDRWIRVVGGWRAHDEPMQVVSGPVGRRRVHFQAPPPEAVPAEMRRFIGWFNHTAPQGAAPLPALTRAGLAHLYFVCIHPFEDGNGRIGRALAEKSLAQTLGWPSLIALAHTMENKRKDYYAALERYNKGMEVTGWLDYFAHTVIEAQATTIRRVDFHIGKAQFHARLHGQLNERQAKAIARMFREGINGFKGGLSAENYITITGASRATATRDLQDLVGKRALARTGELRYTRYHLNLGGRGGKEDGDG